MKKSLLLMLIIMMLVWGVVEAATFTFYPTLNTTINNTNLVSGGSLTANTCYEVVVGTKNVAQYVSSWTYRYANPVIINMTTNATHKSLNITYNHPGSSYNYGLVHIRECGETDQDWRGLRFVTSTNTWNSLICTGDPCSFIISDISNVYPAGDLVHASYQTVAPWGYGRETIFDDIDSVKGRYIGTMGLQITLAGGEEVTADDLDAAITAAGYGDYFVYSDTVIATAIGLRIEGTGTLNLEKNRFYFLSQFETLGTTAAWDFTNAVILNGGIYGERLSANYMDLTGSHIFGGYGSAGGAIGSPYGYYSMAGNDYSRFDDTVTLDRTTWYGHELQLVPSNSAVVEWDGLWVEGNSIRMNNVGSCDGGTSQVNLTNSGSSNRFSMVFIKDLRTCTLDDYLIKDFYSAGEDGSDLYNYFVNYKLMVVDFKGQRGMNLRGTWEEPQVTWRSPTTDVNWWELYHTMNFYVYYPNGSLVDNATVLIAWNDSTVRVNETYIPDVNDYWYVQTTNITYSGGSVYEHYTPLNITVSKDGYEDYNILLSPEDEVDIYAFLELAGTTSAGGVCEDGEVCEDDYATLPYLLIPLLIFLIIYYVYRVNKA